MNARKAPVTQLDDEVWRDVKAAKSMSPCARHSDPARSQWDCFTGTGSTCCALRAVACLCAGHAVHRIQHIMRS